MMQYWRLNLNKFLPLTIFLLGGKVLSKGLVLLVLIEKRSDPSF